MRYSNFLELDLRTKKEVIITDIATNTMQGREVPIMENLTVVTMRRYKNHYIVATTDTSENRDQTAYAVITRDGDQFSFSVCRLFSTEVMSDTEDAKAVVRLAAHNTLGRAMTIENDRKANDAQHLFPTLGVAIQDQGFIDMVGDDYEGILISIFAQSEHRSNFETSYEPPVTF